MHGAGFITPSSEQTLRLGTQTLYGSVNPRAQEPLPYQILETGNKISSQHRTRP